MNTNLFYKNGNFVGDITRHDSNGNFSINTREDFTGKVLSSEVHHKSVFSKVRVIQVSTNSIETHWTI